MVDPENGRTHVYRSSLRWSGTTAVGYKGYDRNHTLTMPPAESALALSGDESFGGDPTRANPEALLLAAASSCQLLSYLALAARSGVDVLDYTDEAEAVMPEDDEPVRITRIVLRPQITIAAGSSRERAERLVGKAHNQCYIANSLRSEVVVEAAITQR